jgi:hypothetical protein
LKTLFSTRPEVRNGNKGKRSRSNQGSAASPHSWASDGLREADHAKIADLMDRAEYLAALLYD